MSVSVRRNVSSQEMGCSTWTRFEVRGVDRHPSAVCSDRGPSGHDGKNPSDGGIEEWSEDRRTHCGAVSVIPHLATVDILGEPCSAGR